MKRTSFTFQGTEYVVVVNPTTGNVARIEKHVPVRNAIQPHTRKMKVRGELKYEIEAAYLAASR